MSSKFFTNRENNSLINKLKGIFEHQSIHYFDALIGYFRASGYFKLRPFLDNIPNIRILVGINVDELIAEAQRKGQLYLEDPTFTKEEFLNYTYLDIADANYDKETEDGILQFIEDIISQKLTVRAYGGRNLHAKIYIFRPEPFNQHTSGSVIMGSSNLTEAGLGTKNECNYEFNVLLRDFDDVKFATDEFEDMWKDATEILTVDIQKLKKKSYLNEDITPYELYLKMLIEYFGNAVVQDKISNKNLPEGYSNLQYQEDAVIDGYTKLMKHNGFILADVVGLGKTVIATRIIKRYIQQNGFNTKVLVVYPNALEVNWKSTIKDFGLSNYTQFISNGSLHKIIDGNNYNYYNPEDYDLIVVDESHKFRTSTSNMYGLLELICKTPRLAVGNDLNPRKKVMLVSATPLNNRPEDIANQIYLFQDARKSTIEAVPNLQSFFADKIDKYQQLYKIKDHKQLVLEVKKIYEPIRKEIFEKIVIRRTRADIQNIKRYKDDIKAQGLSFPEIKEPQKIEYAFNDDVAILFADTIDKLVSELGYHRYRAIEFMNDDYQELYDNAKRISRQLSRIMQTQMVKRLESSFYAFIRSLERFREANRRMINMFENDRVFIAPDLDINKFYDEGREDEIEEKINALNEQSPNNAIYKASDFDPMFLEGLIVDQKILDELFYEWNKVGDYDPKLKKFLSELNLLFLGNHNIEKKLIIFSESKETVLYLGEQLAKIGRNDVLTIDASNHKLRFNTIRKNFDANYNDKQETLYNILLTTEVLAEGINLHRSNVIINYDIPWNATKLMQRIGRVNRIGTKASEIYIYNFYPTTESNSLIHLNEKALRKLQGFHTALSEDSRIYSDQEELIDSTLGVLNPQEEVDERLLYLETIRELFLKNPKEYKRLKELPLKSRVGRFGTVKNETASKISGQSLRNVSLSYLRNNIKEGFYLSNEEKCIEITFLQAVKLFEADKKEKGITVSDNHFASVNKAISEFKKTYNTIFISEDFDTGNLSVQERNAVLFLRSILDLQKQYPEELHDDFVELIRASLKIIYLGVFRKFRNEIAGLASRQKKKKQPLPKVVVELSKIISRYPVQQIARMESLRWNEEERQKQSFEAPKIVLTETFI